MKNSFYYFLGKIKEFLNIEEEKNIKISKVERKYISREKALEIADYEKNLRYHMYKDARDEGVIYGLIDVKRYYATLVKIKGELAWFIRVIDGIFETDDNERGYFDDYSNISCLVIADTGEFIYLGSNYDTRKIKMVTDDEFLDYLMLIKK